MPAMLVALGLVSVGGGGGPLGGIPPLEIGKDGSSELSNAVAGGRGPSGFCCLLLYGSFGGPRSEVDLGAAFSPSRLVAFSGLGASARSD